MKNSTKERMEADKLHLSDEQLIAVASVAIRAAALDMQIDMSIKMRASGLPKRLNKMVAELSTPKKVDLLGEWYAQDFPKRHREIREFISRIHAARAERDDVIHRHWSRTENPSEKELWDLRGWPNLVKKSKGRVTSKWLLALADRLHVLSYELDEISTQSMDAVFGPPALLPELAAQQDSQPNLDGSSDSDQT